MIEDSWLTGKIIHNKAIGDNTNRVKEKSDSQLNGIFMFVCLRLDALISSKENIA